MIETVRTWLPIGVLDLGVYEQKFNNTVAAWQNRWFDRFELRFVPRKNAHMPDSCKLGLTFEAYCEGGAIALTDDAKALLAAEILGVDFDKLETQPTEQGPVDVVVNDCLNDLRKTLADTLNADLSDGSVDTNIDDSDYVGTISDVDGRILCTVRVKHELLTKHCKAKFQASGGETDITARWTALENSELQTGVRLGACEIPLSEMISLQPGDVLTLDQSLQNLLDITIDGQVASKKTLKLSQTDSDISLTLTNGTY